MKQSRFSGDEPLIAFLERFAESIAEGTETDWLPHVLAVPTQVHVGLTDELHMMMLSIQDSEDLVKAGQLSTRTPFLRAGEIARATALLEIGKKPVSLSDLTDYFKKVKFAHLENALSSTEIRRLQQFRNELLSDPEVYAIIEAAESLTVDGKGSAFDSPAKIVTVCTKCNQGDGKRTDAHLNRHWVAEHVSSR